MDSVAPLNLDTTLGAYQIGVLISYILFGVTTTQMYIYYSRFPDDSLRLKALVMFIWICAFVHELCIGHTLYSYTISNYGNPDGLIPPKTFDVAIFLFAIVTICVQLFYSHRVYALSKKLYIPILIWTLSFLILLGCTTIMVTATRIHENSMAGFEAQWGWLSTSIWGVSAANNSVIAVTLVSILIARRDWAQKRTMVIVDKVILWTIETGLLMSISGIMTLVFFFAMRKSYLFMAFFNIDAPMMLVSFLATLNSRQTLRAMNDVSLPLSIPQFRTTVQLTSDNPQIRTERQVTGSCAMP